VRRRLAAGLLAAGLLAGCGTASPDLFEVRRSGADRAANLTMVVSDGGSVTCNGKRHPLGSDRLLRARELVRELERPAQLSLDLPPGPRANLSYRVRLQAGEVAFSDTSRRAPRSLLRLAAYTKDVAERVCGIVR
jgi:hypothetical protein